MAKKIIFVFVLALAGVSVAAAQKRNPRPPAAPSPTSEKVTVKPTPTPTKKNERPSIQSPEKQGIELDGTEGVNASAMPYRYEFTQPDFTIDHIIIEHAENGKGTISFSKKGYDILISDPIQVSDTTLEKLNAAFTALNFVESTEDYQFERDFSNMGNVAITLKKNGRERIAKYNWTSNKDAKFLMDEYRRIANQFIWMFDINLARENQPLEAPKLVDSFDSLMRRNEIADPKQMVPFLTAISNDERIPLIGRNRAGKLVKQIEKQKN
ncbi:MAG TPA: hypothetical protein VK612_13640 [Pyrinomonadaceae bacterium]|nr:hypothetical protein [Pyrinomonadaceae bacterium]